MDSHKKICTGTDMYCTAVAPVLPSSWKMLWASQCCMWHHCYPGHSTRARIQGLYVLCHMEPEPGRNLHPYVHLLLTTLQEYYRTALHLRKHHWFDASALLIIHSKQFKVWGRRLPAWPTQDWTKSTCLSNSNPKCKGRFSATIGWCSANS